MRSCLHIPSERGPAAPRGRGAASPAVSAAAGPRCICYVASTSLFLANSRLPLMQRMTERGWRVIAVAPRDPFAERIARHRIEQRFLPISREIMRPTAHLRLLRRLTALYRIERPALVHHFGTNPMIYGSLAARIARVPAVVNAVTGRGSVFSSTRWDAGFLRAWIRAAYPVALNQGGSRTIFENPDDLSQFVQERLLAARRAVLVRGSGVDLTRFAPAPEPGGEPTIVCATRMLWSKGIADLVAAARRLRAWEVRARILLVGWHDAGNRDAVPLEQLHEWNREGMVTWIGARDDMPQVFAGAHIVVLPSYGEGVPRSLIEAAASGRAIVTTDVDGCREIVRNGHNGFLVPPRNPDALAEAIATLLRNPARRRAMGKRGRALAVAEFADSKVVNETLAIYDDLLGRGLGARPPDGCRVPAAPSSRAGADA